jgi:hypothetical protein
MAAAVPFSQPSKRWMGEERLRDSRCYGDDDYLQGFKDISDKLSSDFISKADFETYYKEILELLQQLMSENEEIRKKNSYLESIVMEYFFANIKETSHKNVTELREVLQLPKMNEKINKSIIFELEGILEDMGDNNKSSGELLKEIRG